MWRTSTENPTKSCPRALVMFATCSWPSLCEQSELQCFAPGLRQISARCPLQRCHTRYAICSQNRTDIFLNFEHPTQCGLNALPSSMPPPPCLLPSIPSLFCFSYRRILPKNQFANPSPMPVSEPRPRCGRITSQTRTCLDPDVIVSRPRRADKSYFPRILDNQPIGIVK